MPPNAKGTIDFNGVSISVLPEFLPLGNLKLRMGEPVVVEPGKSTVLHTIEPFSPKSVTVIVAMGVTQHPGTTYRYNSDGRELVSLVPLGEFHAPLYTKRDLGLWLVVGEKMVLVAQNDDSEAHRYASIVWTFDRTKE